MADNRQYKRSWKNLLINKRYQLRFTLFMVVLSSLLMVGLGIWVMKEADETTNAHTAGPRTSIHDGAPSVGDTKNNR